MSSNRIVESRPIIKVELRKGLAGSIVLECVLYYELKGITQRIVLKKGRLIHSNTTISEVLQEFISISNTIAKELNIIFAVTDEVQKLQKDL